MLAMPVALMPEIADIKRAMQYVDYYNIIKFEASNSIQLKLSSNRKFRNTCKSFFIHIINKIAENLCGI